MLVSPPRKDTRPSKRKVLAAQAAKKAARETTGNNPNGQIQQAAIFQGVPDQQQQIAILKAMGRDVELPIGQIEVSEGPSSPSSLVIGRIDV